MTVKVQGKSFEFSEDEAREVMKQLFGQYFDFRGTLEHRGYEADDKMMDFIGKNLFDEVLDDDMFWDLLEKDVLWIADRFIAEASNDEAEVEREFNPDDREAIASYYEENYTMDRGYAVSLMGNVLNHAFYMIKDRDERIDFLDYVLEDFRKNAGEER